MRKISNVTDLNQVGYLTIIARKWFDRVNGNTYHSCEVYFNNKLVDRDPYEYGYGDHYLNTASKIITNNTKLDCNERMLRHYISTDRRKVLISVTNVSRKGEL